MGKISKYSNLYDKDGKLIRSVKMKRQEKMDPAQRDAYQILLKELENLGEEATPTRQKLQLALQLDEEGEFYKFIEVFGDSRIDGKDVLGLSRDN